jgi:hypothetical protein
MLEDLSDKILIRTEVQQTWYAMCQVAIGIWIAQGHSFEAIDVTTEVIALCDGVMTVYASCPAGSISLPLEPDEWKWKEREPSAN